jgi:hypothetical protein
MTGEAQVQLRLPAFFIAKQLLKQQQIGIAVFHSAPQHALDDRERLLVGVLVGSSPRNQSRATVTANLTFDLSHEPIDADCRIGHRDGQASMEETSSGAACSAQRPAPGTVTIVGAPSTHSQSAATAPAIRAERSSP